MKQRLQLCRSELPVMHARLTLACAMCALLAACSEPAAIGPTALIGTWITEPLDPDPKEKLTLKAQEFSSEVPYTRTEGAYRLEGWNRIVFEPKRLISWERSYESTSVRITEPYPYGSMFDDASYYLNGERLTLHYTTYPADAPVETTRTYVRQH